MAGEALFLGWGPVVRGREQQALQVFQETVEYYGKLQEEGRIDSFEPVLIAPHGGDLGGFMLIRGERSRLDEIRSSEEFERVVVRAGTIVENVGVINAYSGEALGQAMGRFQTAAQELAG
jgi:hypothetical protein